MVKVSTFSPSSHLLQAMVCLHKVGITSYANFRARVEYILNIRGICKKIDFVVVEQRHQYRVSLIQFQNSPTTSTSSWAAQLLNTTTYNSAIFLTTIGATDHPTWLFPCLACDGTKEHSCLAQSS